MPNLYTVLAKKEASEDFLSEKEKFSVYYHNIFDYPLNFADLVRWMPGGRSVGKDFGSELVVCKEGFYFLEGKEVLIYKRILRGRISSKKFEKAKGVSRILSLIPTVKMVAITGSLAMKNVADESDIDLLIITKKGTLWVSRLISYFTLWSFGIKVRKAGEGIKKDRFCLNMWMDEGDLGWPKKDQNLYTAHEIAQITPLVNRDRIYEKFIYKNKWIKDYWPNSVKIRNPKSEIQNKFEFSKFKYLNIVSNFVLRASNLVAFKMQYAYMKPKITREIVTPTRAIFHPHDWSKVVLDRLNLDL
jgi:predicted nucleotidyltransferase